MGAIAAHRAPERVADGTRTQVWAWMTNKCRKWMNEKRGYITTEISQKEGGGEEGEKGGRLLRRKKSWKHISSDEESSFPGT